MTTTPDWVKAMWEELDELEPLMQHVAAGEWITLMQQTLVPALAQRRREKLQDAVNQANGDLYLIADQIGSRKNTIERLLNEGRALSRERVDQQNR